MNPGTKLELKRREINMTQDEVARYLGISRNTLASYESGKAKIPASVFVCLADLYNCSVFEIFGVYADDVDSDVPIMDIIEIYARRLTNKERLRDTEFKIYSDAYYEDRYNKYIEMLKEKFGI